MKTPLTSCGVYDALDQRWEQARAVADPPSASVPPTRSRVSQERFAFPILLTFGRFACPPWHRALPSLLPVLQHQ